MGTKELTKDEKDMVSYVLAMVLSTTRYNEGKDIHVFDGGVTMRMSDTEHRILVNAFRKLDSCKDVKV
jgi:uncharacterized circularly permuted ATP-grasp superfamily protein